MTRLKTGTLLLGLNSTRQRDDRRPLFRAEGALCQFLAEEEIRLLAGGEAVNGGRVNAAEGGTQSG